MTYTICHYPDQSRFMTECEGVTAYVEYIRTDRVLDIVHTIVPQSIGGRGIAAALVRAAFDYARENGLVPQAACPYAHAWLLRHPEYLDRD